MVIKDYGMSNVLVDGIGFSIQSWKVVKNKPYCDNEFVRLSDLAKLFLDEDALRVENSETLSVLLTALHKKYPCDQYIYQRARKDF